MNDYQPGKTVIVARVDFYILEADNLSARHYFACRLAEKAYKSGVLIYIYTTSADETQQLDDLLWTFREDSFVPHQQFENGEHAIMAPIQIGHHLDSSPNYQLLINLSNKIPNSFNNFNRVSEIVVQQQQIREATRNSYQYYKDQGYPLHLHKIPSA